MIYHVTNSHKYNKGITQTFYTVLIALLAMGLLILILILFIKQHFDIQLTIQDTEQSRGIINLAQVLMSSDKLAYVDSDGVLHRGVMDTSKAQTVSLNDLQSKFDYSNFYYTVIIRDLDKSQDIMSPSSLEDANFHGYKLNVQILNFPVVIRYSDGTMDAGVLSIKGGYANAASAQS